MAEKNEPRGFSKAKKKTEALLENKEKLNNLLLVAKKKSGEKKQNIKAVWIDFQTLLRLVKAWRKKEYTDIPWKTILYAASAIFYFVSPLDLIPDFIPFGGFLDDITVITFVVKSLKEDLEKFKNFENKEVDEA
ncbi:MAG: DUF1232 domain-containing protein [Flavobacteriales bacterium]|nr:DUF1232 domain-containing protein [Flavobacteriales bacterium]